MKLVKRWTNRRLKKGDIVVSPKGPVRVICGRGRGYYLYTYLGDTTVHDTQGSDPDLMRRWYELLEHTPADLDWLARRADALARLEGQPAPAEWELEVD